MTSPSAPARTPTLQGVEPPVTDRAVTDPALSDPAEGAERDRDLVALEDAERELADLEEELGGTDDAAGG